MAQGAVGRIILVGEMEVDNIPVGMIVVQIIVCKTSPVRLINKLRDDIEPADVMLVDIGCRILTGGLFQGALPRWLLGIKIPINTQNLIEREV
jgi:hypothetical protein